METLKHELELQSIMVVINNEADTLVIKEAITSISDASAFYYSSPEELLSTNIYKRADVFIVSSSFGDYDGRKLYLEQRNRFRIVPFLFILDRPVTDADWDFFEKDTTKDLYDYIEKPLSIKKLRHRVSLMLTITHMYNEHRINTIEGLRSFWKDSVIRDREMIVKMKQLYKEGK